MREILLRPIVMSELWHGAITNLPQDYNQCMIEWEPSSDGWCSPSEESLSRFRVASRCFSRQAIVLTGETGKAEDRKKAQINNLPHK